MSPIELLLFGAACYLFGLVSGAVLIPWLVDRGLFPVRRHGPCEVLFARGTNSSALLCSGCNARTGSSQRRR